MEQWDIFDKSGQTTGKKVNRGRIALDKGEYHLVVHIWIIGSDGRLLIQRRSDLKPLMPGEWAATGGAAIAGETSKCAARRELFEELGIDADDNQMNFIKRLVRKNSFIDIYLVRANVPVCDLKLQTTEVSEAKWVHRNKLQHMIRNGDFHNYGKDYFEIIFSSFAKKNMVKGRQYYE
ncbi:MAG: NUDIX domain-containing protein [Oscillospiraceae bacterium]|nr:NUDIX domain-containing protein [Oscillospiraceae bacterium]